MSEAAESAEFNWNEKEADDISKKYLGCDPFHGTPESVAPSLLSATDIVRYVEKTAMITPFFANKDKLKHASYEACIGGNAYIYGKTLKKLTLVNGSYLKIPANEIVFVESDITFRLPKYIAARFNLQIKHVHRGLLLGTGPLVDPGFRGKLLIPLHNLTSEDYYIKKDEGFIWIEFSRTTFNQDRAERFGDYPDYKKISDGSRWLHKASFDEYLKKEVPIRSSIWPIANEIAKRSNKAFRMAKRVRRTAIIGALALFLTFGLIMLGEIYTNRSFMQSAYNSGMVAQGPGLSIIDGVKYDVVELSRELNEMREINQQRIEDIFEQIRRLQADNDSLTQRVNDREADSGL